MLYCPKCKSLCEDSAVRCPECGKRKLREPTQLDKVLLVTVTEMEAQRLEPVMKESGTKAAAQDAPEEEEMSRGKRMLVQIVSVLAFILLIWLVVMGTDWIANNLWSWVQNQGL